MLQHRARRDVQNPGLRRKNKGAVRRDRVPGRTKTGTVQHRARIDSVGKGDRGGAVPRLHDGGVVFKESAHVPADVIVSAPRLRNQHQHRVREGAAAGDKKFQRVVQGGGIALPVRNDGNDLFDLVPEQRRFEHRFPRLHVIEIAPDRVDLSVVGQIAERMRQRPRRERVRAVPLMDDRKGALAVLVRQIRIEAGNLMGEKQTLVDHRAGGETDHIGPSALILLLCAHLFENFPRDVEGAFEFRRFRFSAVAEEALADCGHRRGGGFSDLAGIGRDLPPCQKRKTLFLAAFFKQGKRLFHLLFPGGKEEHCKRVFPRGRKNGFESFFPAVEFVGDLNEDSRAVAGLVVSQWRRGG